MLTSITSSCHEQLRQRGLNHLHINHPSADIAIHISTHIHLHFKLLQLGQFLILYLFLMLLIVLLLWFRHSLQCRNDRFISQHIAVQLGIVEFIQLRELLLQLVFIEIDQWRVHNAVHFIIELEGFLDFLLRLLHFVDHLIWVLLLHGIGRDFERVHHVLVHERLVERHDLHFQVEYLVLDGFLSFLHLLPQLDLAQRTIPVLVLQALLCCLVVFIDLTLEMCLFLGEQFNVAAQIGDRFVDVLRLLLFGGLLLFLPQ
mmetsp:Transcript_19586/g.31176  ORF Transcript_19586/g.31176 Transcript_19586/m.31176 type:complete len:258 (+) Transcript_19586:208-981(+)